MAKRYDRRGLFRNSNPEYMDYFAQRGGKTIAKMARGPVQFNTPNMKYPTPDEVGEFNVIDYVWKRGDKFFKLAHKHYGDPSLWWIIPWFNKKPFAADYKFGDVVHIPLSISQVYDYFD